VLGTPFLESGDAIPIVLDTNRADVVSIKVADYDQSMDSTNVTIIVQALRQGTALVRVIYKSDPQIVDWIMIKVGAYVSPQSATVHIGGHVTFSIIGKGIKSSVQHVCYSCFIKLLFTFEAQYRVNQLGNSDFFTPSLTYQGWLIADFSFSLSRCVVMNLKVSCLLFIDPFLSNGPKVLQLDYVWGEGLHGLPAGERGSWLSGNESIVHVNIHTGEAVAIGEGTTTVSFNGSRLTTYGTITVIQVVSISIGRPSSITLITNVPMPQQGIRFPVKFRCNFSLEALWPLWALWGTQLGKVLWRTQ
jgi:hypothetical protein